MNAFALFICAATLGWALGCESAANRERRAVSSNAVQPTARPGVAASATTLTSRPESALASDSEPPSVEPPSVAEIDGMHPPIFVVKGNDAGSEKLVILHGMCGDGPKYAEAFPRAALRKGTLIAPRADIVCGDGPGSKWSKDIAGLDARIVQAFKRLGHPEPIGDVCVLGMSQGATRAAALVKSFPERYTRLVSMGAPTRVSTLGLQGLRAAAVMVGERERKDLMHASERALKQIGVPAKSFIIPDADHAGLGPTPELTMDEVLNWLWENSRAMKR